MNLLSTIGRSIKGAGRGLLSGIDNAAVGSLTGGGLMDAALGSNGQPFTPTDQQRKGLRGQYLMGIGSALQQGRPIAEGIQQYQQNAIGQIQAGQQAEQQNKARQVQQAFNQEMQAANGVEAKLAVVGKFASGLGPAATKQYADAITAMRAPVDEAMGAPFQTTGPDGKPAMAQQFKSGNPKILTGYAPAAEKDEFTSDGVGGVYNRKTGLGFPVDVTINGLPGQARPNYATGQYMDDQGQPITQNPVSRAAKPTAPHTIPTAGGYMYLQPDGSARPVLGPDGKPVMPTSTITHNNFGAPNKYDAEDPVISKIASYEAPLVLPRGANAAQTAEFDRRMKAVLVVNPKFDMRNYATAQKTLNAFATGAEGRSLTAINTVAAHAGELYDAIDALKNSDGALLNRIGNSYNVNVRGLPPAAAFRVIVNRVGPELVKAYVGTGGTGEDRKTVAADFDENLSPAILKSNTEKTVRLLRGKMNALKNQFEFNVQGRKFEGYISPEAMAIYDRLDPPKNNNQQSGVPTVGGTFNGMNVRKVTRIN